MKKILAMILSVSMIAGMMVLSASAEEKTGGLSVDKAVVTTAAGDEKEFTLTSEIPAITGEVNNVTMRIDFDKEVLEYTGTDFNENKFSIPEGTPLGNTVTSVDAANQNGFLTYTVVVAGGSVVLSGGHTAHFTFKVKDQAKLGATTIQYNNSKTTIKNSTEVFTPANWSSSVSVDVITDYIKTVQVSGISVEAGSALPATATLTAEGLESTSAAITWNPSDTTAADQDYGFTLNAKALTDATHEYRFADQVTVTGLEDFSEVTAIASEDGKTLTITGKYVSRMLGDVNNDGDITMDDALEILKYSLGESSVIDKDPVAAKVADVNNDGDITMDDALEILKYSLGESSIFDKIGKK